MDAIDDAADLQERCELAQAFGVGAVQDVIVGFMRNAKDKTTAEQLAIAAIERYVRAPGEPDEISQALLAVTSQRVQLIANKTEGD